MFAFVRTSSTSEKKSNAKFGHFMFFLIDEKNVILVVQITFGKDFAKKKYLELFKYTRGVL